MRRRIGFLMLLGAVALAFVAHDRWNGGWPPVWSQFGERVETVVLLSEVRDEIGPDGKKHHWPHVEIAWPPGSQTPLRLEGVLPQHDVAHLRTAERLAAAYRPGKTTLVRVIDGVPLADRPDIVGMTWAVAFSLFAVIVLVISLILLLRTPREIPDINEGWQ